MKYTVIAMRTVFGARCSCPDHKADSFDVMCPENGHWVASSKRREDAEAVAAGLWATDLLAEQAQEMERIRLAIGGLLDNSEFATATLAVEALIASYGDVGERLCEQVAVTRELVEVAA